MHDMPLILTYTGYRYLLQSSTPVRYGVYMCIYAGSLPSSSSIQLTTQAGYNT